MPADMFARDGYSTRPALFRAVGATVLLGVVVIGGMPRPTIAIMGALVLAQWGTLFSLRAQHHSM